MNLIFTKLEKLNLNNAKLPDRDWEISFFMNREKVQEERRALVPGVDSASNVVQQPEAELDEMRMSA